MLKDLSLGKPPDGRIGELSMKHTNILKHALKCEKKLLKKHWFNIWHHNSSIS